MLSVFTNLIIFNTKPLYAKSMKNVVKVRIYPNYEQAVKSANIFGGTWWVWNNSLALINRFYQETGKGLTRNEIKLGCHNLRS